MSKAPKTDKMFSIQAVMVTTIYVSAKDANKAMRKLGKAFEKHGTFINDRGNPLTIENTDFVMDPNVMVLEASPAMRQIEDLIG